MKHLNASGFRRIRDQRAMTAPRNRFRAHDRARTRHRAREQPVQRRLELGSLHVIRVGTESGVPPLDVGRVRSPFAPPAKFGEMRVAERRGGKRHLQGFAREVRIAAGNRKGADIDQMPHALPFQKLEEILEASG